MQSNTIYWRINNFFLMKWLLCLLFLSICAFRSAVFSYNSSEEILNEYNKADDVGRLEILSKLLRRMEKIESVFNVSTLNPDMDDMSYLELFWEDVKKVAVGMIPPSDKECRFHWRTGACYPKCRCSFQYIMGDYSLDRGELMK